MPPVIENLFTQQNILAFSIVSLLTFLALRPFHDAPGIALAIGHNFRELFGQACHLNLILTAIFREPVQAACRVPLQSSHMLRLEALDIDFLSEFARLGDVERILHPHQGVHIHAERLFEAQGHFAGKVRLRVHEAGERRARNEQDGSDTPRVVVLGESVARHYWPDSVPIGQRIRFGGPQAGWYTVVGICGDVKDWFGGDARPAAYVSDRQLPRLSMRLLLRTTLDPAQFANSARAVVRQVDGTQPVYNVKSMEQIVSEQTSVCEWQPTS